MPNNHSGNYFMPYVFVQINSNKYASSFTVNVCDKFPVYKYI